MALLGSDVRMMDQGHRTILLPAACRLEIEHGDMLKRAIHQEIEFEPLVGNGTFIALRHPDGRKPIMETESARVRPSSWDECREPRALHFAAQSFSQTA